MSTGLNVTKSWIYSFWPSRMCCMLCHYTMPFCDQALPVTAACMLNTVLNTSPPHPMWLSFGLSTDDTFVFYLLSHFPVSTVPALWYSVTLDALINYLHLVNVVNSRDYAFIGCVCLCVYMCAVAWRHSNTDDVITSPAATLAADQQAL